MDSNPEALVPSEPSSKWYQNRKDLGIAGLVLFFAFILVGGSILAFNSSRQAIPPDTKKETSTHIADGSIVYGYWKGENAVISAVDLSVNKNKVLALIPTQSKHIRIVSKNTFTYIGDTDEFDYGKNLVIHTIDPSGSKNVFSVEDGYGIDDYVLSPNKTLAALWVVGKPNESDSLSGNRSRVYSLNIQTGESHLIYDEESSPTTPVHYPVGITNAGTLYLDTFLPNSGAGWAYGMSTSDFTGTSKQNIPSMANGTYSSQPVMSQDGEYLAFSGYDGADGTEKISTFRKALINPNTVELLSTSDNLRKKIDTKLENVLYSFIAWDSITGDLIISTTQSSNDNVSRQQYSYKVQTDAINRIENDNIDSSFLAFLQNEATLFGERFPGDQGGGNLGPYYSNSLNRLTVKQSDDTFMPITLDQLPVQLIDTLPANYFPALSSNKELLSSASSQQLKLKTFELKPTLIPVREVRQSTPVIPKENPPAEEPPLCATIVYPQCNALLGTNYPIGVDLGDIKPPDPAFNDCFWAQAAPLQAKNVCADSPLYLYGKPGTKVNVLFGTEVFNSNIPILRNSIDLTILADGNLSSFGNQIPSLSFDYISKIKRIGRPENGYVIRKEKLKDLLTNISKEFRFNEKETKDVLEFGKKVEEPFVFVSFFDDKVSKSILPIYFEPKPDVYRNIVFYFEGLESKTFSPERPEIDPIIRSGFTAIELSFVTR